MLGWALQCTTAARNCTQDKSQSDSSTQAERNRRSLDVIATQEDTAMLGLCTIGAESNCLLDQVCPNRVIAPKKGMPLPYRRESSWTGSVHTIGCMLVMFTPAPVPSCHSPEHFSRHRASRIIIPLLVWSDCESNERSLFRSK